VCVCGGGGGGGLSLYCFENLLSTLSKFLLNLLLQKFQPVKTFCNF